MPAGTQTLSSQQMNVRSEAQPREVTIIKTAEGNLLVLFLCKSLFVSWRVYGQL